MKLVFTLLVGCMVFMAAESRLATGKLYVNQVSRCQAYFQQYHECRDERRERIRQQNEEAKRNLTKAVQLCFTEKGCAAPVIPQQPAETPAEKECKQGLHDAKRTEVQNCVKVTYSNYEFAKPHPRRPKDHLLERLLGVSVDQCPNKDAVVTCRDTAIEAYRKSRYQFKCAAKAGCRVLMSSQCQDLLSFIHFTKCKCKTKIESKIAKIREGVAACQGVTPKAHKHHQHHFCPLRGYCREGYDFWRNQHSLAAFSPAPKASPAAPQPPREAPVAPQQPVFAAPQDPKPAAIQVPAVPQQPIAPAPQAPQPAAPKVAVAP